MDLRGRDDGGVHRIDVARHDRLQRRHDVAPTTTGSMP
jgi:hypothetical protein